MSVIKEVSLDDTQLNLLAYPLKEFKKWLATVPDDKKPIVFLDEDGTLYTPISLHCLADMNDDGSLNKDEMSLAIVPILKAATQKDEEKKWLKTIYEVGLKMWRRKQEHN